MLLHCRLAVLCISALPLLSGCGRGSPAPQRGAALASQPAVAVTLPASLPPAHAASHIVSQETIIGRSEGGKIVYESIAAGTPVQVIWADPEWARVRTGDGRCGLLPTARVEPTYRLAAPRAMAPPVPPRILTLRGMVKNTYRLGRVSYATVSLGIHDEVTEGTQFFITDPSGARILGYLTIDSVNRNESFGHLNGLNVEAISAGSGVVPCSQ